MEKSPSAPVERAEDRTPDPVRQDDKAKLAVPADTPLPPPAPGARFTDWAAI